MQLWWRREGWLLSGFLRECYCLVKVANCILLMCMDVRVVGLVSLRSLVHDVYVDVVTSCTYSRTIVCVADDAGELAYLCSLSVLFCISPGSPYVSLRSQS